MWNRWLVPARCMKLACWDSPEGWDGGRGRGGCSGWGPHVHPGLIHVSGWQKASQCCKVISLLQYFGHLMQRVDFLEKTLMLGGIGGKRRRGQQDEMAGWHHRLDGCESEWTPGVGDGQGGLACCDSWGRKESDTTERLIWSDLIYFTHGNVYVSRLFFQIIPPSPSPTMSKILLCLCLLWYPANRIISTIFLDSIHMC